MAPVIRTLLCEVCRPLVVCVLLNKHGHEGQHADDYKECELKAEPGRLVHFRLLWVEDPSARKYITGKRLS